MLQLCLAMALQAAAQDDQFVLVDVLHTHTTKERVEKFDGSTSAKAFSYFPIPDGAPANWKGLPNFFAGTVKLRIEVISKPSNRLVNYQMCVWQKGQHSCCGAKSFSNTGVYEWQESFASFWNGNAIDWTQPLAKTMLVIKDKDGNPVDDRFGFGGKWDGSPNFDLYYPMTVRFTAVAVAKGAVYNPNALLWRIGDLHFRELKELRGLGASWEKGALGAVLMGAEKELDSTLPARAEEAKKVVETLKSHAERRRKDLEALKLDSFDFAKTELVRLGQLYAPSPLGMELLAEAKEWEKDPAVARARKAKSLLETAQDSIRKVKGKGKAGDAEFARRYAADLRTITQVAEKLRRDFSDTPSCAEMLDVVAGLGLRLQD
jgi:hypothetical protein